MNEYTATVEITLEIEAISEGAARVAIDVAVEQLRHANHDMDFARVSLESCNVVAITETDHQIEVK